VTNTTRRPRAQIVERLRLYGFEASAHDVITAVLAGAEVARGLGARTVAPYVTQATLADLGEFDLLDGTSGRAPDGRRVDAVLVGDLGDEWTYRLLQEAFRHLMDGARLIALSGDRYWMRRDGLALDAGPFVAALEYATGTRPTVAGKPSAEFYHAAVSSLGLPDKADLREVVMVGDDIWSDVQGAQQAGLAGWLVRTGKYRDDVAAGSGVRPDRVLGSVAELEP
jgi:phospholysine phosphohistidine inorganic pyrophosphate phosphatase